MTTASMDNFDTKENFADLLEETFGSQKSLEGSVLKGRIIKVENDFVLVDVGIKSEGRISLKEFYVNGQQESVHIGDMIDVFIERMEDRNGEAMLSREKARREASWLVLEQAYQNASHVDGTMFGRVKGGFTVDINGSIAFLPGSQVDIRPVKDVTPLMGIVQPFIILKMDRARGNIVVSRRSVLEESRAEARTELVQTMEEGRILEGMVKNLTDYGAFIDLGGVDGLLHVTDISWRRINHPSEMLTIGQTVKVQVVRFNKENQRISLGMKQLESDPWAGIDARYPVGARVSGRVSNVTDYGAFIELEPGIEGLVHVSEMSWTKKNMAPGKIVSTSQEVMVQVLDFDMQKRRISLGIKQCMENPWDQLQAKFKAGDIVDVEVKNATEFGIFAQLTDDIDGMVHLSDISWNESDESALGNFQKGQIIKVKVLDIDPEKERVSLGIKQLTGDPLASAIDSLKKGQVVTCEVTGINDGGVEVMVEGVPGFIRKVELSRERAEQKPERFSVGEKVDAKITQVDKAARKINLSIKAHESEEEKQAMADFGSSDSGASLGDILGAALSKAQTKEKKTSK